MDKKPMHTPGPWQVLPEEMGKNYLRVRGTVLGLRYKIADVRNPDYEGVTDNDVQMTRANARLIAGAPEMFQALDAVETLFGHLATDSTQRDWVARVRGLLGRIA